MAPQDVRTRMCGGPLAAGFYCWSFVSEALGWWRAWPEGEAGPIPASPLAPISIAVHASTPAPPASTLLIRPGIASCRAVAAAAAAGCCSGRVPGAAGDAAAAGGCDVIAICTNQTVFSPERKQGVCRSQSSRSQTFKCCAVAATLEKRDGETGTQSTRRPKQDVGHLCVCVCFGYRPRM